MTSSEYEYVQNLLNATKSNYTAASITESVD